MQKVVGSSPISRFKKVEAVQALVNRHVTNGGGMPAFGGRLTPQQIDAIANYVSHSAGRNSVCT
jgi:mono/diheme cytochrome c family protein